MAKKYIEMARHICLPVDCRMCELLWPNEQAVPQTWPKSKTMNAKPRRLQDTTI